MRSYGSNASDSTGSSGFGQVSDYPVFGPLGSACEKSPCSEHYAFKGFDVDFIFTSLQREGTGYCSRYGASCVCSTWSLPGRRQGRPKHAISCRTATIWVMSCQVPFCPKTYKP